MSELCPLSRRLVFLVICPTYYREPPAGRPKSVSLTAFPAGVPLAAKAGWPMFASRKQHVIGLITMYLLTYIHYIHILYIVHKCIDEELVL